MKNGYFDALTSVRGLLAFWVISGHLLNGAGYTFEDLPWWLALVGKPGFAVFTFMLLSGFVISHLIITKSEPYGLYIWRRWLRLFPLLAFAVSAALVIVYLLPGVFPHMADTIHNGHIVGYLLAYAMMIHGAVPNEWLPEVGTALLAPAWSISLEWQFYLLAPLLVWPLATGRYWLLALLFLVSMPLAIPAYQVGGTTYTWFGGSFLPNSLHLFLIGIAAYGVFRRLPEFSLSLQQVALCFAAIWTFASIPLAIFAVTVLAIKSAPSVNRLMSAPVLVWLGEISYSLYLTHMLVLHTIRYFFIDGQYPYSTFPALLVLSVLTIPITVFVSYFTHRYIELPFIKLGSRRIPVHVQIPGVVQAS